MTVFHVAVATAIICVQIVTALNDTEHQALKVQINDAKHAKEFSTLLNSIVNVNKERYDTLKRMSRLQQFPSYPPRQTLRGGESEDSSEDDDDGSGPEIVAYLVLPEQDPNLRASGDSSSESGEMETGTYPRTRSKLKKDKKKKRGAMKQKMNEKETLQVETLASSESKKCIKACKKVQDEVCDTFECTSKLQRVFKKECKRACEDVFK
ncbi:uncharacterized protein isoform X3 [Choristoneura fumiferana]|uniref:uncharacterized protein isoform X3 n=1 Tax=Choristoneura fumiferana TaxID=7141 RepID=UPI003D153A18